MRVNIGCGAKPLEGWTNTDIQNREGVDVVCSATFLPFDDYSVSEMMAIHVLEHLYPWHAEEALAEFARVLRPGGLLILELPDFRKCCANIASDLQHPKHPDMLGLFGMFGDPRSKNPHMMHKWGYTPETLSSMLRSHGFVNIRQETPQFHRSGRFLRDMRIVCNTPEM